MSDTKEVEPVDASATPDKPKVRKCLACATDFESAWSGERICKRCKSSNRWKSGALR